MNKNLQKAIMNRSRLLYSFRKEKPKASRSVYKHRTFLCETIKKRQKGVLQEPECKLHQENKLFWKNVKLSFTEITLVENRFISDECELVEIFSRYLDNIMRNLGTNSLTNFSSYNNTVTIRKAVEKYQNYPSIKVIRENIDFTNNFSFLTSPIISLLTWIKS